MKIILNNPYRTVGLLVGATAKEQERQVRRLKQFIEVDQEVEDDFSFPGLGKLERTVESVNDAMSKLDLNNDRINAALFWFFQFNHIDEASFETLKDDNLENALHIWERRTSSGLVSQNNFSAFHNLSNLKLLLAFGNGNVDLPALEEGISLKLKFLESNYINDFKSLATDATYKATKKDLQILFLNQLHDEIEKAGGNGSNNFLEILNKQEFSAKEDFLKGIIHKPIEEIEKQIQACKDIRKSRRGQVLAAGTNLYKTSQPYLKLLSSILGKTHLKYSSISDKVSDEILQCGIQLFNDFKDDQNYDPGEPAKKLFKKAESLAIGNIAIQRCEENTEHLEDWIEEKPNREKQARVFNDLNNIKKIIEEYETKSETVANARALLSIAHPILINIKSVLGSTDDLYLNISSRIASDAQGMCVSEVNQFQEKFSNAYDNVTQLAIIKLLKVKVNEAYDVTTKIGAMDVVPEFRARYVTNRTSLLSLKNQLDKVNVGPPTYTRSASPPTSTSETGEISPWVWVVSVVVILIILLYTCE